MICIVGEQGSGKSTLANELEKLGYEKVITYTSRPPRDGEIDGEDYHFKSQSFIDSRKAQFMEVSEYRNWKYGSMKADFHKNSVVVLTPAGMRALKRYDSEDGGHEPLNLRTVYLCVPRRQRLKKLLDTRADIDEILRRDQTEVGQFDGIKDEVDYIYINENYQFTPSEIAEFIKGAIDAEKEES